MEERIFSGHQPNFIPYMGVFHKIEKSDVFVLDDDVQYSNTGLHNANYIKVNGKKHKIVVPVNAKFGDAINEVKICYNRNWVDKMLRTIKMNYGKTKHFDEGYELMERYLKTGYEYLSDMNTDMIREISRRFGFDTKIIVASESVPTNLKNNERNVSQCLDLNCNVYYSGIGGKEYNDIALYNKNGIEVRYSDYEPIEYGRDFIPNLSVLDYIMYNGFNT